jgi:hypothetical protein
MTCLPSNCVSGRPFHRHGVSSKMLKTPCWELLLGVASLASGSRVKHVHLFGCLPALILALLFAGCALFTPKGQIEVQVVSWPLVKQLAEPDAGLAGQTVLVQKAGNLELVAKKTTDASGLLVFEVPAGNYVVRGIGNQSETVTVGAKQVVRLKLIEH